MCTFHPEAWLCLLSASFRDFYTPLLMGAQKCCTWTHPEPPASGMSAGGIPLGGYFPALEWSGGGAGEKPVYLKVLCRNELLTGEIP